MVASGSANYAPWVDFQVTITQYERLWKDRSKQDTARIEAASNGLAQKALSIVKYLQQWTGQTSKVGSADFLAMMTTTLNQPARMVAPGIRFNKRKLPLGWSSVDSTWDIPYNADISVVALSLPPSSPGSKFRVTIAFAGWYDLLTRRSMAGGPIGPSWVQPDNSGNAFPYTYPGGGGGNIPNTNQM